MRKAVLPAFAVFAAFAALAGAAVAQAPLNDDGYVALSRCVGIAKAARADGRGLQRSLEQQGSGRARGVKIAAWRAEDRAMTDFEKGDTTRRRALAAEYRGVCRPILSEAGVRERDL